MQMNVTWGRAWRAGWAFGRTALWRGAGLAAAAAALGSSVPACAPTPRASESAVAIDVSRFRDESGRAVDFAALPEPIRRMAEARLARAAAGEPVPAMCFAPGTPEDVMRALNARFFPEFEDGGDFQQASRWTQTASGASAPAGSPVTVTWSIVPDGTAIAGFNNEPAAPSNLRAFLDGIYGSQATWLPVLQRVTDRWNQVSGIRYVYEPNDDGVALNSAPGVLGVRGDVRIGGHTIDGAGNVLAYNFYPNSGDQVIDTGDTFFSTTTNSSLRLRNVVAHELGHGLGMAHVCPVEQTKLMEPSVSEAFDGPRHDDIRHAHLLYGDASGDNNSAALATDLGAVSACEVRSLGSVPNPSGFFANLFYGSLLSIDAAAEQDFYRFTLDTPRRLTAIVSPVGVPYDDSPQASGGACTSGNLIDSLPGAELGLAVLASDGATVLAQSAQVGAGVDKSVSGVLLAAGTYYLRVSALSATRPPQLYTMNLAAVAGALDVSVLNGAAAAVAPGQPAAIDVSIASAADTFVPAGSVLEYRLNGGAVQTAPLALVSGSTYRASIPSLLCGDSLTFRVVAQRAGGPAVTQPCTGEFAPVTGSVVAVFSDDFEANLGWTVGPDTATAGFWTRDDPVATTAQPEYDNTPGAGTRCYFTGQAARGALPGTNDLDSGETRLASPVLNLGAYADATVTYARWLSTGFGNGPYNDRLRVQVSTNGGTSWTTVQTIGPGSGTDPDTNGLWRTGTFTLAGAGIVPTATMRIRFVAEDAGVQSLVEAAIDDVVVTARSCAFTPAVCPIDYNADGFGNLDDLGDFITDFYTVPAIPGGAQAAAPTYPGVAVGYGVPCPQAADAPGPYATDAYRVAGYRVGYSPDGVNACPVDAITPFPNLDNLGDFITFYYEGVSSPACQ